MASVFTPGSGGDLQATHKPNAFLEMAFQLQTTEQSISADVRPNNITITADLEALTASVTGTLPIGTALNTSGQVVVVASDYLVGLTGNSGFNNGGGDLKSTNEPAAFFEMAQILHAAEQAVPAETRPNNITITVDFEAATASVAATLPIAATEGGGGAILLTAVDYL